MHVPLAAALGKALLGPGPQSLDGVELARVDSVEDQFDVVFRSAVPYGVRVMDRQVVEKHATFAAFEMGGDLAEELYEGGGVDGAVYDVQRDYLAIHVGRCCDGNGLE